MIINSSAGGVDRLPLVTTVTITPADWDAETKLAAVQADWAVAGMSATFAPVESSMNVFTDIAVQGVYCTNILNGDLLFKSGSGATVNENITLNVTAYNDGKGIIVNAEIVGESINGMSITDNSFDFTTSDNGSTITNIKFVFKLVIPPYDDHGNEITAIQQSNSNSVVGELYLINNIKTVENSAFYNSSNLKKVYIGKQLTLIGAASGGSIRSFGNCPNLSEVVFERERTELLVIRNFDSNDANALFYNSAIENLVIPENVQLIEKPFANCTKLKAVRYESSYGLGYPFRNCTALEELTFTQATPVTVGTPAQTFNSAHYIFVPYDSFTAYTTATNWTSYASYMYGIGKFTAGTTLPTDTTDAHWSLTWYATKADLKASNNPITVAPSEFDNEYGEIYCSKSQYVVVPFAEASWAEIKEVFRSGNASNYWSVGDTKSITINGNQYTIRIADMTVGRYTLADGSGSSNGVFEFVGTLDKRYMRPTRINTGGWASSYMKDTVMGEIYDLLPNELKDVISEVNVLSGTGGGTTSGTSSSSNKLFLPAEMEIFSSKIYSIGNSECPLGQFDYYRTHDTDTYRIKKYPDNTTNGTWWLRSSKSGSDTEFCYVSINGNSSSADAYNNYGVSPCFAI